MFIDCDVIFGLGWVSLIAD
jgi:hypothetical protein